MPNEARDIKIKRLKMRSMRRGIKEMDLILTRFSDMKLHTMSDAQLDEYDALLSENDQDLYQWCSFQKNPSDKFLRLIKEIREFIEQDGGVAKGLT